MTSEEPGSEVLFFEPGASWWWLLVGPLSALAMVLIQVTGGGGIAFGVPAIFLVLVSGFLGIQIKAARIHTSVELTPTTLRQGTEFIDTADIVRIFPEAKGAEAEKWQSYRALGELTGVPRGRTGIGLKMTDGRSGQAWARRHRTLRAALDAIVGEPEL
ncbi:MAG: DUF3093 domain-containing protein [Mycolicibacterium cosmeticum]|nr:DUF3093 domain-containing protein [Mycolicibacterium cosmeticum]